MKLTKGVLVAIFAALPNDVAAQCAETLNPCEIALYESAVTWENRAKNTRLRLSTCLGKLQARSATVTDALVVPDTESFGRGETALLLLTAAFSGLMVGGLLGILVSGG